MSKQLSDEKLDYLLKHWAGRDCLERDAFLELKERRASALLGEAATKLELFGEQKDIPAEYIQVINEHFWDLL